MDWRGMYGCGFIGAWKNSENLSPKFAKIRHFIEEITFSKLSGIHFKKRSARRANPKEPIWGSKRAYFEMR